MSYSIGLDYGTNSVRCLIVDTASGEEVATVMTLQQAWDSLRIVQAERESARTGRKVVLEGPKPGEVVT